MTQPEARFKAKIRQGFLRAFAGEKHWETSIVASLLQRRGIPDLFFAADGASCWIEAKVQASCKYPLAQRRAQYNLDEAGGGPVWVLCLRPSAMIWAARPEYFDSRAAAGADHHRLYPQDRLQDRAWWSKLLAGAFP